MMNKSVANNANGDSTMEKNLKDKVVIFHLSEKMTMPDMIKLGYQRTEITALFVALQENNFGVFSQGSRGKGKFASFEFWSPQFPKSFTLVFKVEKLRKEYAGKPAVSLLPEFAGRRITGAFSSPGIGVTALDLDLETLDIGGINATI